jgi:hypothetical protein
MQRILIATLMAMFFGLFSMPALQAAPADGAGVGNALKAMSPIDKVWRRRRRRCWVVHRYRSRGVTVCD